MTGDCASETTPAEPDTGATGDSTGERADATRGCRTASSTHVHDRGRPVERAGSHHDSGAARAGTGDPGAARARRDALSAREPPRPCRAARVARSGDPASADQAGATREGGTKRPMSSLWDVAGERIGQTRAAATLGRQFVGFDRERGTIELSFSAVEDFTNLSGNVLGGFLAAMLYE